MTGKFKFTPITAVITVSALAETQIAKITEHVKPCSINGYWLLAALTVE